MLRPGRGGLVSSSAPTTPALLHSPRSAASPPLPVHIWLMLPGVERALPRRRGVIVGGGRRIGARPPPLLRARAPSSAGRWRGGARAGGAHPARGEAARRRAAVDHVEMAVSLADDAMLMMPRLLCPSPCRWLSSPGAEPRPAPRRVLRMVRHADVPEADRGRRDPESNDVPDEITVLGADVDQEGPAQRRRGGLLPEADDERVLRGQEAAAAADVRRRRRRERGVVHPAQLVRAPRADGPVGARRAVARRVAAAGADAAVLAQRLAGRGVREAGAGGLRGGLRPLAARRRRVLPPLPLLPRAHHAAPAAGVAGPALAARIRLEEKLRGAALPSTTLSASPSRAPGETSRTPS